MTKHESKARRFHREFKRATDAVAEKLDDRDLVEARKLLDAAKELVQSPIATKHYWLRDLIPAEIVYYEVILQRLKG